MQKLKKPGLLSRIVGTLVRLQPPVRRMLILLETFRWPLTTAALMFLFLLLLATLSGCQPKVVRPTLPAQAEPRPMPEFKGRTYRDALIHIPELREWGTSCEADKEVIRQVFGDE